MRFKIIGTIKGKARPRTNFKTGIIYTPNNTKQYEKLIRESFINSNGDITTKDISVVIVANFKIPKSYTKKKIKEIEEGKIKPHKIDVDNISKIVLDGLNKVAYFDDRQVVKLSIEKRYTKEDENIEIEIKEL